MKTAVILILSLALFSCEADRTANAPPPPPSRPMQPDDVLYNVELAWNERNIAEYERLLDSSFTFVFSLADYTSGATPDQWGRLEELAAVGNMFNPNYSGDNRVVSIDLKLQYVPGNWVEITPPNPVIPGEKWYTKTVIYNLIIDALPNITFLSTDIKAEFTIRRTQLGGKDVWRIIVWRDQIESNAAAASAPSTKESSWGKIKTLYGG